MTPTPLIPALAITLAAASVANATTMRLEVTGAFQSMSLSQVDSFRTTGSDPDFRSGPITWTAADYLALGSEAPFRSLADSFLADSGQATLQETSGVTFASDCSGVLEWMCGGALNVSAGNASVLRTDYLSFIYLLDGDANSLTYSGDDGFDFLLGDRRHLGFGVDLTYDLTSASLAELAPVPLPAGLGLLGTGLGALAFIRRRRARG